MAKKVKIEDVLGEAFKVFKKNWLSLILAGIVTMIGSIFIITAAPLFYGFFMICADAAKNKKIEVLDVLKGFNYFLRSWGIFIASGFLFVIAGLVGIFTLFIPVILVLLFLMYTMSLSVLKNLKAIDSISASYRLAMDNLTFSIILGIVILGINAVGGKVIIGGLLTFPFVTLTNIIAVMKLSKK